MNGSEHHQSPHASPTQGDPRSPSPAHAAVALHPHSQHMVAATHAYTHAAAPTQAYVWLPTPVMPTSPGQKRGSSDLGTPVAAAQHDKRRRMSPVAAAPGSYDPRLEAMISENEMLRRELSTSRQHELQLASENGALKQRLQHMMSELELLRRRASDSSHISMDSEEATGGDAAAAAATLLLNKGRAGSTMSNPLKARRHGSTTSGSGNSSRRSSRKGNTRCNLCGNDIVKENMPAHLRHNCPVAREICLLAPRNVNGETPKATDTVQCLCGIYLTNKNMPRHVQFSCSSTAAWRRKVAEQQRAEAAAAAAVPSTGSASPKIEASPVAADGGHKASVASPAYHSLPTSKSRSPSTATVPGQLPPPPPVRLPPPPSSVADTKPAVGSVLSGEKESPSLAIREREVPSFLLELKHDHSRAASAT